MVFEWFSVMKQIQQRRDELQAAPDWDVRQMWVLTSYSSKLPEPCSLAFSLRLLEFLDQIHTY